MRNYIIYLLLFCLPFIYYFVSGNPFEPPKVIAFEFLTVFFLLISIWKNDIQFSKLNKSGLIAIGMIFVLSLLPLLLSQSDIGIFGNKFRLQGTILLWHLLVFSILSSAFKLQNNWKIVFGVFSLLGILTVAMPFNLSNRAIATLGEPNALSAVFIFWIPFLLLTKDKRVTYAAIAVTAVLLFLTGSRSGMIAFVIQLIALGLHKKYNFSLLKVTIISLVIIVISYTLPFLELGRVFENRIEVWNTSLHTALQQPIFGHGFGNAETGIKETAEDLHNTIQYQYVDSAHNIFLDWFIQGGLVGLGLLVYLLFTTFKTAIQRNDIRLILCLLGLLTCFSFNPLSVVSLVALWWLIGQGLNTTE